ncbi:phosphatidylinositol-specific phospholipase C domain-containing protein [Mucilaginibacter sp. Mucisp86]|uniref:phosphatidylinositol-specific phospholipase C domain-containing protein n=1 Tax=Mucilaginibacter sp. Mucisp86 TaxID=3243060 RepID=UPI0039B3DDA9
MKLFLNAFLGPFMLILVGLGSVSAQNLSLSAPLNFLPSASTDKAIDITNFKGRYFVTWKESGATGLIHVCYLGKRYDTQFSQYDATVGTETSASAPVLRVTDKHIYTFWIGVDGFLKYIINNSDTTFNTSTVNTVSFAGMPKLKLGVTATTIGGKVMIASHADNKNDMVFALLDEDENGVFKPAVLETVADKRSSDYPFIVTLSDNRARICYTNDDGMFYADYNPRDKIWTKRVAVEKSKTKVAPAVYHAFNTTRLFYMWKGYKKDNFIYYASEHEQNQPVNGYRLPDYFKTPYPVSICNVDAKKFIMAFVGEDQKLYLSYFTNYNPASWMEDTLFPAKGNLTLKDIVIPGAHDAGMSALNGTGGIHGSSINPCNTLTQKLNIGKQLNAGIRMFDLRVGAFKNAIYIKHSSSDCMADAMGGGYGEQFKDILDSVKTFLNRHEKEFIIITFSHFCPKEASADHVADTIFSVLGKGMIYNNQSKSIGDIKLNDLAGKVIITFEQYANREKLIDSNSMADKAKTFLNFRRAYAGTNQINKLLAREELFFTSMKDGINKNDLVRLDWQLTQSSDEAALICNDFEDEKVSPVVNGIMLLTNVVKKNQSITDLAQFGNKYLPSKINSWITSGIINKNNKPNILYVDVAGTWITDYCIELNGTPLYN